MLNSKDAVTVIIDYREALSIFAMLSAGLGLESGDLSWVGLDYGKFSKVSNRV